MVFALCRLHKSLLGGCCFEVGGQGLYARKKLSRFI